jgi:transposase InsO family protein
VNGTLRGLLAVGTRLAYDGQWWQVAELDGPHVLLAGPVGVRRVSAGHLLADPSTQLPGAPGDPVEGAGPELAGLDEAEMAELRERIAHVQEVRTGFRRGCAELAADGEPRPEYAPGVPLLARYAAKAAEIGVGVSTLRRWVKDFGERGPAGLADDRRRRRQQPLTGADPRWLEMARRVLAEHTESSKPTRDLILAEVTARLDAEHGHEAVPVLMPTRARALLREITMGTSAFGGTKAKREIADRPAAPYGRLRAMRPGEYLLLDTTRLDVFAMDPVTLRWVQAELTIAMDLYDRCVTGLRLTPVSTKAVDAAAVLFESVRPTPEPATWHADDRPPYHGLPSSVVIDAAQLATQDGEPLLPSVAPETIVCDYADPPVMPTGSLEPVQHPVFQARMSA